MRVCRERGCWTFPCVRAARYRVQRQRIGWPRSQPLHTSHFGYPHSQTHQHWAESDTFHLHVSIAEPQITTLSSPCCHHHRSIGHAARSTSWLPNGLCLHVAGQASFPSFPHRLLCFHAFQRLRPRPRCMSDYAAVVPIKARCPLGMGSYTTIVGCFRPDFRLCRCGEGKHEGGD